MTALLFATFLFVLSAQLAWTAPPAQPAADGEAIFRDKCAGCHTIGGGPLVGPDLEGVTTRTDPQWLADFIAAPDKVLAAGDPTATALLKQYNNVQMPNLGLSQDQLAAIIAYLQAPGGTSAPTPVAAPATGDPVRGEALFLGNLHFQNDGPPCMSCHSIDNAGILGGGAMGPNLTQAFAKYGDAGLASALATIPFPTMKPIFADGPLTPQEQADLHAYIQCGRPATDEQASSICGAEPGRLDWADDPDRNRMAEPSAGRPPAVGGPRAATLTVRRTM